MTAPISIISISDLGMVPSFEQVASKSRIRWEWRLIQYLESHHVDEGFVAFLNGFGVGGFNFFTGEAFYGEACDGGCVDHGVFEVVEIVFSDSCDVAE